MYSGFLPGLPLNILCICHRSQVATYATVLLWVLFYFDQSSLHVAVSVFPPKNITSCNKLYHQFLFNVKQMFRFYFIFHNRNIARFIWVKILASASIWWKCSIFSIFLHSWAKSTAKIFVLYCRSIHRNTRTVNVLERECCECSFHYIRVNSSGRCIVCFSRCNGGWGYSHNKILLHSSTIIVSTLYYYTQWNPKEKTLLYVAILPLIHYQPHEEW